MVCHSIQPLLAAVRTSRTISQEETVDPKEFKKTKEEQRKNECKGQYEIFIFVFRILFSTYFFV